MNDPRALELIRSLVSQKGSYFPFARCLARIERYAQIADREAKTNCELL